jgi:hypothetical protein
MEMRTEVRFHEVFQRDGAPAGGSDRNFGLVFAGVCFLVGSFNYYRGHDFWPWWLAAAMAFLVLALVFPTSLRLLNRVWTQFGFLLHRVMQPLILGLLFFLTILPMGLLLRAAGKDLLRLRINRLDRTYWLPRDPPGPAPDSFKNQF